LQDGRISLNRDHDHQQTQQRFLKEADHQISLTRPFPLLPLLFVKQL
jgi:hypothetical protein